MKKLSGNEIRNTFIEFFKNKDHTFVKSASLVPGGDQTLLFTNAGMVQFKDIFLGKEKRDYNRAVNSQKCMRVAGKHNDLDEVGRDDTHHTFFEMLGNWSFGDYYKKEAIAWAWELLTEVWGVDKSKLWVTYFKDEKNEIPTDEEAAEIWRKQPGIDKSHILPFGRADNFWEMADTGPCGPCSEIHVDLGPEKCDCGGSEDTCGVNTECSRYLELWNLVFIQYNRLSETELVPLPQTHVDTGMGFERIVSYLQKKDSNYKTDLLWPVIEAVQKLSGESDKEREINFTSYRVIADHIRAASFLIADGVVPGNVGRNYICRMILRRAALFGSKIGLDEPFLYKVAPEIINKYGEYYPELKANEKNIQDAVEREEKRFKKTVEAGLSYLDELVEKMESENQSTLNGTDAFELYATHGLPLEITRDILREKNLSVDEAGYKSAMEQHRLDSGGGKAMGSMNAEDVEFYSDILDSLVNNQSLKANGVEYNPYGKLTAPNKVLSILANKTQVDSAEKGEQIEIILPFTAMYVESGGQVADTGSIKSVDGSWIVDIKSVSRPVSGLIVHSGIVREGAVNVNAECELIVNADRRDAIKRNHTATHLLHEALHQVIGEHARQAGSLVSPDYLRFDFTHSEPLTPEELNKVQKIVNEQIISNHKVHVEEKNLDQALEEGATALFGEKYGDNVRTITLGHQEDFYSYELCGGTHVDATAEIGLFIITSESSIASGVRRIEAVTGLKAYEYFNHQNELLKTVAGTLNTSKDQLQNRIDQLLVERDSLQKEIHGLRNEFVSIEFEKELENVKEVNGISVFSAVISNADSDSLRKLTDIFRRKYESGVILLGTLSNGKPLLIASVSDDLVKKGYHAGKIVKEAAAIIGGGGGGKPSLAQAGGSKPEKIEEAVNMLEKIIS